LIRNVYKVVLFVCEMKRGILVFSLFVCLFVAGVVSADGSTTETNFNIAGCTLPTGDGLAINTCSRGDVDGEYYCDSDTTLWTTRDVGLGCSMGETTYNLGDPFCCPAGMFCNATSGQFQCAPRLEQCYDQMNQGDCEAIGCIWLEEQGICADGTRDYSCSLYTNPSECAADVWNLGRTGIGTEVCGSYIECGSDSYTIPYESCRCEWDSSAGVCDLKMNGTQTYYSDEDLKKWFTCSKDYTVEECIEGKQNITWTANSQIYNGFPSECLTAVGCTNGASTRMCGEPIIKLPGFSLFALLTSIVVLVVYYYRRDFVK
jgi:hypothetical protein